MEKSGNMARKPMYDGGTKNKIVEVASKMFFEKGYEGTSVRAIMREVGGEIGLFYYYYESKDALFSDVLENSFEPYKAEFEKIARGAQTDPYQPLLRFFVYVKKQVRIFREKYEANMHRTVRWAIRERTLTVMEPYIERIIRAIVPFGAKPVMPVPLTAVFLSHGIGSIILHEDADWVDNSTEELRKTVNLIMGLDKETSEKMFGYSIYI